MPKPRRPVIERFNENYVVLPSGCWEWIGLRHKDGYGRIWNGERHPVKADGRRGSTVTVLVHRWAYEHFKGPVPAGFLVRHTCGISCCVNPSHLIATDTRRCGHPNTDENTVWERLEDGGRKSDGCRICCRAARRRWDEQRRRIAGAKRRPTAEDVVAGCRRCSRCGEVKRLEDFHRQNAKQGGYLQGRYSHCKTCSARLTKAWRERNPGYTIEQNRLQAARLRAQVLSAYGGSAPACACCGESEPVFLALDHIDNDGGAHRRRLRAEGKNSSAEVYRELRRKGSPPGYQILCHNCNWAKHMGGCPHRQRAHIEVSA